MTGRRAAAVTCVALLGALASPRPAAAREIWHSDDYERTLELETALKAIWLLTRAPNDPLLFPERTAGTTLGRLRLTLTADPAPWMTAQVAYEHRIRITSSQGGGLTTEGLLPASAPPPFRIAPVEQTLVEDEPAFVYVHELDRAFVAFHLSFGEVTVGRQPLGFGRGVLFSAVDIFAPFTPLEIDREWRRGVDAVHAEVRFNEHLSTDAAVAFGETVDDIGAVARVRGYVGDVDGALLFGKRAEDYFVATTFSATVGDAEVHGEAAFFRTDGMGIVHPWPGDEWVVKAVAGGSYVVDVGNGLRLAGEYSYSGFGLRSFPEDTPILLDPAFQARLVRGDTQTLGRHDLAAVAGYDPVTDLTVTLSAVVSPVDGSGVVYPTLTWQYSDGVTVTASAFLPWGRRPRGGVIRSENGITPFGAFLQLSLYD